MARNAPKRPRPPLDEDSLRDLALSYLGRFATTRAKLASYLSRKLRERGWGGERPADIEAIVGRMAELGYVDDAAFALSKSRALTARGYGGRRVGLALRSAGVDPGDGEAALGHAEDQRVESALRFAQKRRIGPFGDGTADPRMRERTLAAMIRAGHDFAIAKAVLALPGGGDIDEYVETVRQAL
ncbi:regulatory protein RecX [Sphingomonas sabuli]|uniref:Regulatory protein RecX n=1 Tax=Sphingomonas sabuli TaxID=2764186 RepID=A0A7G9L263_9SPHN|nr:regulatory protein RecX [Sphingomonas sabuli]QNM82712.1 regulatory protein RecX [Sphingomonas sabuli]